MNTEKIYKILLVDDSESDRGIYCRYLLADKDFGYEILEAESLEEGLELWRSQSPDLVLTEINLPDGSGLDLLEAIGKTNSSLKCPVIVMTGQGNERIAVQAMKLGASDYLVKDDITASMLCHCIETAIAQWNFSGELTRLRQPPEIQDTVLQFKDDIFRAIFDNTFQFIGLLTPDGMLSEANQTALTVGGLQREDVVGCLFWETNWFKISRHTQEKLEQSVIRAAKGEFIRYEVDVWGANQRVITIDFSLRPVFNESGQVICIIPEGRDITDQKEAELLLRQQALVFENITDGVIITDMDGIILDWNRGAENLYGYTKAEILGQSPSILHRPEEAEELSTKIIQTTLQKGSWSGEIVAVCKDGTQKNTTTSTILLKDATGKNIALISLNHDITNLKIAKEELRQSNEQLQQFNQELETKVKERTHELETSEAFNRQLITEFPIGLASCRMDGQLVYVNPHFAKILGRTAEETLNLTYWDITPIKYQEQEAEQLRQLQETGSYGPYEKEYIHKDGHLVAVSLTGLLIKHNGETLIWSTVQDIRDRKQAQEALKISEERFRNAFDTTAVGMCLVSPSGEFLKVNPALCNFLGYSETELLKMSFQDITHHEDLATDLELLWQVVAGEITHYNLEKRYFRKDTTLVWGYLSVSIVKDSQKQPLYFVSQIQDITIRKQAEFALQKSEERFRRMFDSSVVGMIFADFQGHILHANNRFLEMLGYTREELENGEIDWLNMTPTEYLNKDYECMKYLMEHGEITPWEKEYYRKDGSRIAILIGAALLQDTNNETICVIVDISDRKQIEENLKTERLRLQLALDAAKMGTWSRSSESDQLIWSDRFQEIFGFVPGTFPGENKTFFSMIHPEDRDRVIQAIAHTFATGEAYHLEYRIFRLDGEMRWITVWGLPSETLSTNERQLIGVIADISDRKQAELQLQKTTDRLTLALKSGAIGCWEWDIAHNTLTWDERMYELYGIPYQFNSALTYDHWANGLHPQDFNRATTLIQQAVAGEAEYDLEFRVIHPDHSIHFIKAYGVVIRDIEGNPQRMIGVNFDITAQKQAEETIRHQSEKETLLRHITQHIRETLDLQRIFDTACQEIRQFIQSDRVGIFRFYPDSGFDDGEFVAESLKEGFPSVLAIRVHDHCFGEDYSQRYAEGRFQSVNDVLKSDLQDCHKAVLTQFQIRANLIIPLLLGQELWGLICIHTCTAPRIWKADEIDLIQQLASQLAIAIQQADLFERLQQKQEKLTQTNEALALSNEDLARATRLKDEFLANMSHELRTPLTAILGMSEALQETDLNQRQNNAAKLIEKSGKHLLDLINDILDLAKIEAGKLELEFSSAPVKTICKNSTIFVKQMAFSKNIQLHTRIAENIGQIWVDERRIRQVLINLLSNAIKFTPSGGQVTLAVELELQEVVFSVTDTGIGITPENLDKLFQPFVQIDSSLSRQYAGTGLGLALVQRIVTGHGGTVSVTSTLGEGSCFAVRLPYVPLLSVGNSLPENAEVGTTLTTITDSPSSPMPLILIADDNEGNIQTMENYLGNKGYRILLAYNGIEAVEMTKIHKPDLILMDIQMPFLDGLQATAQIRSDPAIAHIPIIALTALALPGDGDRCLAAGVNEYLAKPVRFKLLIEMIQKLSQNQEPL